MCLLSCLHRTHRLRRGGAPDILSTYTCNAVGCAENASRQFAVPPFRQAAVDGCSSTASHSMHARAVLFKPGCAHVKTLVPAVPCQHACVRRMRCACERRRPQCMFALICARARLANADKIYAINARARAHARGVNVARTRSCSLESATHTHARTRRRRQDKLPLRLPHAAALAIEISSKGRTVLASCG